MSLDDFISELRHPNWKSGYKLEEPNRPPPGVPEVVCLDETWQHIGALRPHWPRKTVKDLPWGDFLTASRDCRVPDILKRSDLHPASTMLGDLKDQHYGTGPQPLSSSKWRQLQMKFDEAYLGPLRHVRQHVWQALDSSFKKRDQMRQV